MLVIFQKTRFSLACWAFFKWRVACWTARSDLRCSLWFLVFSSCKHPLLLGQYLTAHTLLDSSCTHYLIVLWLHNRIRSWLLVLWLLNRYHSDSGGATQKEAWSAKSGQKNACGHLKKMLIWLQRVLSEISWKVSLCLLEPSENVHWRIYNVWMFAFHVSCDQIVCHSGNLLKLLSKTASYTGERRRNDTHEHLIVSVL